MAVALALLTATLGAVSVTADAPFAVSGKTPQVTLTVAITPPPARETPPFVATSVGELSKPEATGPGTWKVTYRLPKERYPQVAIIGAAIELDGGLQVSWLTLPIHGRDSLELTTKPSAAVTVLIAGKDFGPHTANEKGKVAVPVEVPPGVDTGTVVAVDTLGNKTSKSVELEPPSFLRVFSIARTANPSTSWAEATPLELEALAIARDGQPLQGAKLSATATDGTTKVAEAGAGRFRITYRSPSKVPPAPPVLRSVVKGVEGAHEVRITLRPGPLHRLGISLARTDFEAGSGTPVPVEVTAFDQQNNPFPLPEEVKTTSTLGALSEKSPGQLEWTLPDRFAGADSANVTAEGLGARASAEVKLVPAEPAKATLALDRRKVRPEDGPSQARVRVEDRFGNPTRATLAPTSPGALLGPVAEERPGSYTFSYAVEPQAEVGPRTVEVAVTPGAAPRMREPFEVLRNIRQWGLSAGGRFGPQWNVAKARGLSGSVELAYRFGGTSLELVALGSLHAFRVLSEPFEGAPFQATQETSYWALSGKGGLRYSVPVSSRWAVQASGLAGVQRTAYAIRLLNAADSNSVVQSLTGTSLGLHARGSAGASLILGRGRLFLEGGFVYAPVRGDVTGNTGGATLEAGYVFDFR